MTTLEKQVLYTRKRVAALNLCRLAATAKIRHLALHQYDLLCNQCPEHPGYDLIHGRCRFCGWKPQGWR